MNTRDPDDLTPDNEDQPSSAEDALLDRLADAFLRGMAPYNGKYGQRLGVTAQMLVEAAATALADLAYAGEIDEEILDTILCGVAEAVAAAREADRAEALAHRVSDGMAGDMQRAGQEGSGASAVGKPDLSNLPDLSKMEVKGHA